MGAEFFMSLGAILAMFSDLRALMPSTQSAGVPGQVFPIVSISADTHEPMSPTSGAVVWTLLSISFGSMSIWMNFLVPDSPQVLTLPCDNRQLRRGPISR